MKHIRIAVGLFLAAFSLTAFAWHHHHDGGWFFYPAVVPIVQPDPYYYYPNRCQRFNDCLRYYGYHRNRYQICVNQFNGDPCRSYYYRPY